MLGSTRSRWRSPTRRWQGGLGTHGYPDVEGVGSSVVGSERVGWWVTFAVALFVGTMWALSVPPSGGPDEPAHMVKAAAVAGGDLSTSVQWHDEFPGKVPDTTVKVRTGYNYGSFWDQVTCWSGIRDQPTSCAPGLPPRTGRPMSTETYVGTYQPLYYGLVGLPTRFLPPDRGLYAARLISVAIVAALAASALASARSMGATTVAATLASFTPAVVFVASTVNPQGPELVASVTLWASGLLVLGSESPRRRELVRIGVSATVLAAARPTGPVLVVIIAVVLLLVAGDRTRLKALARRRSAKVVLAATTTVWLASLAHVVVNRSLSAVMRSPQPGGLSRALWDQVAGSIPDLTADQVGLLSWHGMIALDLIRPLIILWLAMIAVLVVAALWPGTASDGRRQTVRRQVILVTTVAGWGVLPLAALIANHEVYWQGRYGLPLGVGIPIMAGWMVDLRVRSSDRNANTAWRRFSAIALAGVSVISATGLAIAHRQIISRNLHGQNGQVLTSLDASLWNGPLSPAVLVAGALAGSVAIAGYGVATSARLLRPTATETRSD